VLRSGSASGHCVCGVECIDDLLVVGLAGSALTEKKIKYIAGTRTRDTKNELNLPRIFSERQTHWGKTKEGPFSGVLKRTGFAESRQPTTQKKKF